MENLPKSECSQCQYGRPYQKNTTIWNNFDLQLKICTCTKKHAVILGRNYGGTPGCKKWAKKKNKIMIPPRLVRAVYQQLMTKINEEKIIGKNEEKTTNQDKPIYKNKKISPFTTKETNTSHLPTIEIFQTFAEILNAISVTTYQDKNGGAAIACCKKHHWLANKAAFLDDTDHYTKITGDAATILNEFEKFHDKMNLEKLLNLIKKKNYLTHTYFLNSRTQKEHVL